MPDPEPPGTHVFATEAAVPGGSWPPSRRSADARIARRLNDAAAGHGHALVLAGEPGIGRSTLLNRTVTQASGRFLVARVSGFAPDTLASGETLGNLLRQLGPVAETSADPGDALLARLDAAGRPVLIAVDDAQWLDLGSLEVLGRVARCLGGRRTLLLLALRSQVGTATTRPPALAGLSTVVLERFTGDESAEMIMRIGGRPGLAALAAGNPLALELFGSGLVPGTAPLDAELRLRLTELFASELRALSGTAREALEEIAVWLADGDPPGPPPPVCTSDGGAELETAGLLLHQAGRWRPVHPLLASAALVQTAPAKLRELHTRAAAALAPVSGPAATTWQLRHRVAAADRVDDRLAAEIEAAVSGSITNAATAGRLLASAARLSSEPVGRLRRMLAGIDALADAGLLAEASDLLAEADSLSATQADRAALADVRFKVEALVGRPALARDALLRLAAVTVATKTDDAATRRAVDRYARAALLSLELGEIDPAEAALALACGLTTATLGSEQAAAAALVSVLTGTDAPPRCDDAPAGKSAIPTAWTRVWMGDLPGALDPLESAVDVTRRDAAYGVLPSRLIALSSLRLASGRVAGALAAAGEAVRLAHATGAVATEPRALLALARAEAVAGLDRDCREHVARAMEWCRAEQDTSLLVQAFGVLGFLALSLGDPAEAVAHLEANPRIRLVEDAVLPWLGDLVEALIRTGERLHARQVLAEIEAAGRMPPALRCALERGLGLLAGDSEQACAHLTAAVQTARGAGLLIEEARALTVLGEVLAGSDARQARRSILAGAALFDRLGAMQWRTQARRMLHDPESTQASDQAETDGPDLALLTAQELSVARLAADGLTNQQVAAALFLSVRTVEFHLSNAYRKLRVHRRAQLVRVIQGALTHPAPIRKAPIRSL